MDLDRKIVKRIDSSLDYVKKFCISSTMVYQVKKENLFYILKVAQGTDEWQVEHLDKEKRNLIILKNINGISHLVKSYDSEYVIENWYFRNPILKEYFEGEIANKITDVQLQKRLEQTVREIHKMGIAGLNLQNRENVMISSDKKETAIIEVGTGKLSRESGIFLFRWNQYQDLKNLEKYIFE